MRTSQVQMERGPKKCICRIDSPASEDDDPFAAAEHEYLKLHAQPIPETVRALARRVKQADDEAYRARMAAEDNLRTGRATAERQSDETRGQTKL